MPRCNVPRSRPAQPAPLAAPLAWAGGGALLLLGLWLTSVLALLRAIGRLFH